jgi:hypothetical protein
MASARLVCKMVISSAAKTGETCQGMKRRGCLLHKESDFRADISVLSVRNGSIWRDDGV